MSGIREAGAVRGVPVARDLSGQPFFFFCPNPGCVIFVWSSLVSVLPPKVGLGGRASRGGVRVGPAPLSLCLSLSASLSLPLALCLSLSACLPRSAGAGAGRAQPRPAGLPDASPPRLPPGFPLLRPGSTPVPLCARVHRRPSAQGRGCPWRACGVPSGVSPGRCSACRSCTVWGPGRPRGWQGSAGRHAECPMGWSPPPQRLPRR